MARIFLGILVIFVFFPCYPTWGATSTQSLLAPAVAQLQKKTKILDVYRPGFLKTETYSELANNVNEDREANSTESVIIFKALLQISADQSDPYVTSLLNGLSGLSDKNRMHRFILATASLLADSMKAGQSPAVPKILSRMDQSRPEVGQYREELTRVIEATMNRRAFWEAYEDVYTTHATLWGAKGAPTVQTLDAAVKARAQQGGRNQTGKLRGLTDQVSQTLKLKVLTTPADFTTWISQSTDVANYREAVVFPKTILKTLEDASLSIYDFGYQSADGWGVGAPNPYACLSNFYPYQKDAQLVPGASKDAFTYQINGVSYQWTSAEAAYHAVKMSRWGADFSAFPGYDPDAALKAASGYQQSMGWPAPRATVQDMRDIVQAKFSQLPKLRDILLGTGNQCLFEGADKHFDVTWGMVTASVPGYEDVVVGKNQLGRILMAVREILQPQQQTIPLPVWKQLPLPATTQDAPQPPQATPPQAVPQRLPLYPPSQPVYSQPYAYQQQQTLKPQYVPQTPLPLQAYGRQPSYSIIPSQYAPQPQQATSSYQFPLHPPTQPAHSPYQQQQPLQPQYVQPMQQSSTPYTWQDRERAEGFGAVLGKNIKRYFSLNEQPRIHNYESTYLLLTPSGQDLRDLEQGIRKNGIPAHTDSGTIGIPSAEIDKLMIILGAPAGFSPLFKSHYKLS